MDERTKRLIVDAGVIARAIGAYESLTDGDRAHFRDLARIIEESNDMVEIKRAAKAIVEGLSPDPSA